MDSSPQQPINLQIPSLATAAPNRVAEYRAVGHHEIRSALPSSLSLPITPDLLRTATMSTSSSPAHKGRAKLAARVWAMPHFRRGICEKLDGDSLVNVMVTSRSSVETCVPVIYESFTFKEYCRLKEASPSLDRFTVYCKSVKRVNIIDDLLRMVSISGYTHLLEIFPSAAIVDGNVFSLSVDRRLTSERYILTQSLWLDVETSQHPFKPSDTYLPANMAVKREYRLNYDFGLGDEDLEIEFSDNARDYLLQPLSSLTMRYSNQDKPDLLDVVTQFYTMGHTQKDRLPTVCHLIIPVPNPRDLSSPGGLTPYDRLFVAGGTVIQDLILRPTWGDEHCVNDISVNDILRLDWDHLQSLRQVDASCDWPDESVYHSRVAVDETSYLPSATPSYLPSLAIPNISKPLPFLLSFTLRLGCGPCFDRERNDFKAEWFWDSDFDRHAVLVPELATALLAIGGPSCIYTLVVGPDKTEHDSVDEEFDRTLIIIGSMLTMMLRHEIELQVDKLAQPRGWRRLAPSERRTV